MPRRPGLKTTGRWGTSPTPYGSNDESQNTRATTENRWRETETMDGIMGLISDRAAVIGVGIVGMAICTAGVGKVATSGNWLSVPGILGAALGIAGLAILGAALVGRELPGIPGDRAALVVLGAIIVVKIGVAAVFKLEA